MSKFHDEFFKAGSPKHDRLMITTLSKTGMQKILDAVCIDARVYSDSKKLVYLPDEFTVCERSNKTITIYNGWAENTCGTIPTIECDGRCSQKYSCPHSHTTCTKTIKKIKSESMLEIDSVDRTYETEVIAKNGNFIIGYADAIIHSVYKGRTCAYLGYKDPHVLREVKLEIDVLVEAKPELNSIGDVLRQIKTYKSTLRRIPLSGPNREIPMYMVITTYSAPDADSLEYLSHEGVAVVTFPSP